MGKAEEDPGSPAATKEIAVVAALGLIGATCGAIGGLVWSVVVRDGDTAVLGTIGSLGVGSLATLAGARAMRSTDQPRGND